MSSQNFSVADELKKLKELLDAGAITQEEFETHKVKLLSSNDTAPPPPHATTPIPVNFAPPPVQFPSKKKHKVRNIILFVVLLYIIAAIIIGITQSANGKLGNTAQKPKSNPQSTSADEEYTKADYLEFDSKTWKDFVNLYKSHNSLMKAMSNYSDGNGSDVDFYSYCEKTEEYFKNYSTSLNYGTSKEENEYLDAFEAMALADQTAAKKLMKYIDSRATSDLNEVKKSIDRATEAATTIAGNRGILLVKAGLTDDEIKEKVENDMGDLEND